MLSLYLYQPWYWTANYVQKPNATDIYWNSYVYVHLLGLGILSDSYEWGCIQRLHKFDVYKKYIITTPSQVSGH